MCEYGCSHWLYARPFGLATRKRYTLVRVIRWGRTPYLPFKSLGVRPRNFWVCVPSSPQRLDEVENVAVQVANCELACIVERVVDVLDEIDTVRCARGR